MAYITEELLKNMKALASQKEIVTGAPSPELVDLWLARAFNAHDVEAAAAMIPARRECGPA